MQKKLTANLVISSLLPYFSKSNKLEAKKVEKIIDDTLGAYTYSITSLKAIMRKYFFVWKDLYEIREPHKNLLKEFRTVFQLNKDRELSFVVEKINNFLLSGTTNSFELVEYILLLLYKKYKYYEVTVEALFLEYIVNYIDNIQRLKGYLNTLLADFNLVELSNLISDSTFLSVLNDFNIRTIGDLSKYPVDCVLALLVPNLCDALDEFNNLAKNVSIESINKLIYVRLSDYDTELLDKRFGFSGDVMSLDDLSAKYKILRDRVRQQVSMIDSKLAKQVTKKLYTFQAYSQVLVHKNGKGYMKFDELLALTDLENAKKFCHLFSVVDIDVKYSADLNVLYDSSTITLEKVIESLKLSEEVLNKKEELIKEEKKSEAYERFEVAKAAVMAKKNKPSNYIVEVLRSYNKTITLKHLQKNKLKDYSKEEILAEIEKEIPNGLLLMSDDTYIYYNKMHISDSTLDILRSVIAEVFENNKRNYITSEELYDWVNSKYFRLLAVLAFVYDHFTFYSLVQYAFKDEYRFDRPYIYKK